MTANVETRAGSEETRETTLAVSQAWLNNMFESSQLALNRNIESQMAPMLTALREMRVNVAMKSDLELFKMEMRQEIDARLTKEAQGKTKERAKTDPFTKQDPWKPGAWDNYQATGASSSGPAHADQGGTSQIPHGKWHPDGEPAKLQWERQRENSSSNNRRHLAPASSCLLRCLFEAGQIGAIQMESPKPERPRFGAKSRSSSPQTTSAWSSTGPCSTRSRGLPFT